MECKPYKARDPTLLYDWCFFHKIRLYKVRIHLCCKKDAKLASGLEAQKHKNPILFKLCKAHVVSQHLHIFFKLSQSRRQRAAHMFLYLLCVCPSFWFEFVSDCFCTTRISSSLTCFPHFVSPFFYSFIHS